MSSVDPYRGMLTQRWDAEADPSILTYERLLRWKGAPTFRYGARPKQGADGLHDKISPHFSICVYTTNPVFNVFCTVGAARSALPNSTFTTRDPRGIRHEYLMHGSAEHAEVICEILLMIAEHPFVHGIDIGPGYALPIGEPIIPGSQLEYLYITYPFLDDAHIYEPNPAGEIDHPQAYIQTLWIVPLTQAERDYLRRVGVDEFETFLHQKHSERYDADLLRASLI